MTIEQLLQCDASTLEAMSDEELKQHFAPYLNVTRPELIIKDESVKRIMRRSGGTVQSNEVKEKLKRLQALAAQQGLNLKI